MTPSGATFPDSQEILDRLARGARDLDLDLDGEQRKRLHDHLGLLSHWNRRLNLTAITQPSRMVAGHILDSLAVLPYLKGRAILDIGSGGGFPGIPVAIARPDWSVTLLDSRGKRVEFLRHAIGRLGLENAGAVKSRIEDYRPVVNFDTLVCRAFASIPDMLRQTRALHRPGMQLVAMKGRRPGDEIEALDNEGAMQARARVVTLQVPQLDAERHLVIIEFD